MHNHNQKEQRIKPRERRLEASNQTPGDSEVDVAGIVDLAGVLVPSINQQSITGRCAYGFWIGDVPPRQAREDPSILVVAALSEAEHVFLALRAVPDPVDEEVGGVEEEERWFRPFVD